MTETELHQDYRPLFKQIFGSRYFKRKAAELRTTRQTLWYVLSGRKVNPKILDPCLQELNERIEFLNSSWKKAKELMDTHRQLRG